jgi:Flp pilus assembly protein TadG
MRLKPRRGAILVITAILTMSAMALLAVTLDFSRMGSLRNELQTSADAGALAGAIQLLPGKNPGLTPAQIDTRSSDSARAYVGRNLAMQGTATVDSVIFGRWDNSAKVFTAGATPTDAITIVTSRQSTGLMMTGLLGVASPRIKARATAWAGAPVSSSGCIKPWAISYTALMSRINTYLGISNTTANLTRNFTPADLTALLAMSAAQRSFDMHLGSGNAVDSTNIGISGNYQAVSTYPKRYDAATNTNYVGPIPGNAQGYRDDLSGVTCHGVAVGDSLDTATGLSGAQNTVDPLIQNPARVCATIKGYTDNTPKNDPTYGDCRDASGNTPTVVAMYYLCVTGCNGKSTVAIKMMGAFTLEKVYSNNNNNPPMSVAEIKGTFSALSGSGQKGGGGMGGSAIVSVVLVK